MNQGIKRLWLEALTSGIYKQGRDRLRWNDDSYCCLGILCNIHKEQTEEGVWKKSESTGKNCISYITGREEERATLSNPVIKWSGLTDDQVLKFSIMNDSGHSFEEIAIEIEKEFPDEVEVETTLKSIREVVLV